MRSAASAVARRRRRRRHCGLQRCGAAGIIPSHPTCLLASRKPRGSRVERAMPQDASPGAEQTRPSRGYADRRRRGNPPPSTARKHRLPTPVRRGGISFFLYLFSLSLPLTGGLLAPVVERPTHYTHLPAGGTAVPPVSRPNRSSGAPPQPVNRLGSARRASIVCRKREAATFPLPQAATFNNRKTPKRQRRPRASPDPTR